MVIRTSLCIALVVVFVSVLSTAYAAPDGRHPMPGNQLPFGGMTDAGVVSVTFYRGVTFDQMVAAAAGQIRQLGATPTPSRRPVPVS